MVTNVRVKCMYNYDWLHIDKALPCCSNLNRVDATRFSLSGDYLRV